MKNYNVLSVLLIAGLLIGCAKESQKQTQSAATVTPPPNGQPYIPTAVGPGQGPGSLLQYGGTANLNVVNLDVMSQYTGRTMNNPQNIRLNLNLTKSSGGTFGGVATITYVDGGYAYQGYFTAGTSAEATKYNRWFDYGGQRVWHGLFEDFIGGIVVVIDNVIDLGDGQGAQDTVAGTVWFKNFGLTYAPHPPTYCWFVSLGPYDCRPWPDGRGVNTYADKNPGGGYVQLGTFTGLSIKAAFNNQSIY